MPQMPDVVVPTEPVVAEPAAGDEMVRLLMRTVEDLRKRLDVADAAVKKDADPGPPPRARNDRPFIRVLVTPYTNVMVEVPAQYIIDKKDGWDGKLVKGYENHENSVLRR